MSEQVRAVDSGYGPRYGPFSGFAPEPSPSPYYSGHSRCGPDEGQAGVIPAGWDPYEVLAAYRERAAAAEWAIDQLATEEGDVGMTAEQLPPELEVLALAAIAKEAEAREKVVKATIGQRYPDGRRETFRSPVTGAKLGMLYRTDPEPKMVITDRAALEEHLRSFPGNLITEIGIAAADMPEALAVLAEHAPGLLTETQRLDPTTVDAALAQSRATGEPAAPGIEKRKPSGSLTVKPDAGAFEQVGHLIRAGVLTWDARPVLTEGEAAS